MNTSPIDFSCFALQGEGSGYSLYLNVEGIYCHSCIWDIERALNSETGVRARMNLSSRRLALHWQGSIERCNQLVEKIVALGYRLMPFDAEAQEQRDKKEEYFLLKCLAVAGFAVGNIMLFSVALWFSDRNTMGGVTRDLLHWVSALIALPSIIYAGLPFYRSAINALRHKRTNMDVPISVAVVLSALMSLFETMHHGEYVYFDSSVMLLFFLLIGRFLDRKARSRAHVVAQNLLSTFQGTATIRDGETLRHIAIRDLQEGMVLHVAAGERVAADGTITSGASDIDTSVITGETLPQELSVGKTVFAGMVNLSAPIEVSVTATHDKSLLADIVRLMENAEQGQARYVRLADKIAGYYTPAVHILGLLAFLSWWLVMGVAWQKALLIATTVLIVTCPCALGLAVPAVQVLASSRLFRRGILLKSADALERLESVDTVVFDKTGTLTLGKPSLQNKENIAPETLQLAASLAAGSRHPFSQAVLAAWQGALLPLEVEEIAGKGLQAVYQGKNIRLGKRDWCGESAGADDDSELEIWLAQEGNMPCRFTFADTLRPDAKEVITQLQAKGKQVVLISGDRESVVSRMATELGITDYHAGVSPVDKAEMVRDLKQSGAEVLMVGDGINDAPALTSATVSMAPSSAMDISQKAADIVFQGEKLAPVLEALDVARRTNRLVRQNLLFSLCYNMVAVPLAFVGWVMPLTAAVAMSGSSLTVVLNAFRLNLTRRRYS